MIKLLLLSLITFPAFSAGIIVRTNSKPEAFQANLTRYNIPYQEIYALSAKLGIYSIEFADVISTEALKTEVQNLKQVPGILYTSKIDFIKTRSIEEKFAEDPWSLGKDSKFSSFALEARKLFGEPQKNKLNQEIVVGIVETGSPETHTSYAANIWINKAEIAGNNIDDDKNGIIDDIAGLPANISAHTTHVAGIMVSKEHGVARTAKLITANMSYFKIQNTTKSAVRSYEYLMALKRRWLLSGGREGANIVAVNSSFGIDGADCAKPEYQVWNDVYNEMGKIGILNVVATTNSKVDIDVVKDLPTTCQSPYIITVGNIDKAGNSRGGFGKVNIDLFSPGTDIVSTIPPNAFGAKTGTSMATPHVAGGVGYLYLIAPQKFSQFAFMHPDQAAFQMKQIILQSTSQKAMYVPLNNQAGHFNLLNASKLLHGQSINRIEFFR